MCNVEFKDRLNFMTKEMDMASDMLEQGGKISFNLHKQRVVCQGLTYRSQKNQSSKIRVLYVVLLR